jgi:hypothetical protein
MYSTLETVIPFRFTLQGTIFFFLSVSDNASFFYDCVYSFIYFCFFFLLPMFLSFTHDYTQYKVLKKKILKKILGNVDIIDSLSLRA